MPYYIYKIEQKDKLELLNSLSGYRDAKNEVSHLRKASEDPQVNYRMIFASSENEAEKLLTTPREMPVQGDD
ncbi:MAG: hypothetical protein RPU52_08745 [Candidatus Sedimenticola sp. (ex Thyasira tokunagai)]